MFAFIANQVSAIEQHLDIVILDGEISPAVDRDFHLFYCACEHFAALFFNSLHDCHGDITRKDVTVDKTIPNKPKTRGFAVLGFKINRTFIEIWQFTNA